MIDYSKFQKALNHLELQYDNFLDSKDRDLSGLDREAIAESVIHRFETCYDVLWKVLKRYLNLELGIPDLPNSPWPIFQIAAENKLLGKGLARWKKYSGARIGTAHDYSGDKAEEALGIIPDFLRDAIELFIAMTKKEWKKP